MKTWLKILFGGLLAASTAAVALAQQPVMTVGITKIDVLNGGFVSSLTLLSGGSGFTNGLGQSIVTLNGGGGSGATATADVVGGAVTALHVTAPGSGYFNPPSVVISGGTTTATATAVLGFTPLATFNPPNEAYGAVGNFINVSALATGTFPAGGFSYAFKVDGTTIGTVTPNPANGSPGVVSWQPPQPGAYFITVTASDGANSATSLPVRYFATGTVVNSPVTNTLVPVGSSVVIKADATGAQGFVQKIQFYDNGAAIGTADTTLPYSLIYTPSGAAGSSHLITAQATDNNGTLLTASASITLTLVNPILPVATCVISSPANNAAIPIGPPITVAVDAHSTSGSINKVELYINGVLFNTNVSYPYTFNWTPTVVGNYNLVALAYDDKNNVIASTTSTTPSTTPAPNLVYVAAPPTVTITSPTSGSTVTGNTQITANATDSNGYTITGVQFFVDGIFAGQANTPVAGTTNTYAVSTTLTPKSLPSVITAVATNSIGLTGTSPGVSVTVTSGGSGGGGTVVGQPPVVSVTAPADGSSVLVGSPVTLSADASDPDGNISSVQFFTNTTSISTVGAYPYNTTWTPNSLGKYTITAKAIDNSGNAVTSAAITVTVTANQPPTVTLTNPSKAITIPAGTPYTLSATASDSDGTIASVKFFANGIVVGTTGATPPYTATWTPSGAGTYAVYAQATDNSNNITKTPAINVTVTGNTAPTVTLTSPAPGSTVAVGTALALTATATDSDGLIASVQFFANGVSLGSSTTPPYKASFTPNAEGVYALTASAIDNAGGISTSAAVNVLAISSTSTAANLVYVGNYLGGFEGGRFAAINLGGQGATFIAYSTSTSSAAKTYYYPGLTVDASGGISDPSGANKVSGALLNGALSGSFDNNRVLFQSLALTPSTTSVPAGYYRGSIAGKSTSNVVGIVAVDGSIFVYATDGTNSDVGAGTITAAGTFTFKTTAGNTIAGTVDAASGFITATVSGIINGTIAAASSGGGAVSDGALRNLSTRGQVGTGANVLITGFVVGGTTAKSVLIRAVGPTLSTLGINSPLADPQLQVYDNNGAAITGAFNDNWLAGNAAAMASVGAFALPANSKDAALVTTLAPGVYTTQVSGVGGGTGVALVEFYDLDSPNPFSTQKVMNVSTRGQVGTGQNVLIAGFVINGAAPKKVLIRAVGGPALAAFGVSGVLTDPFLTLQRQINGNSPVVRENDNWEMGNDASLVVQAAARVGAFPLTSGSKDAVLLITLPPGTYTALVSGVGNTSGVALVEVYEVPVP